MDETVIQLGTERYWLYAAVDPETNEFLYVRLFPTRPTVFTKQFLQELQEKHEIADAVFLADGAPWLQVRSSKETSDFSMSPMEIGMLPNVSSKR